MMDGIIDNLKVIGSMVFKDGFMPTTDENGNLIQSKEQASEYKKRFKKRVEDGEILRYSMVNQISPLACYKEFDNYINEKRGKEADRLNENYYGKEKYLRIKQCM
jgi:CRISPR/Cas system-associated endonuclease Cas1